MFILLLVGEPSAVVESPLSRLIAGTILGYPAEEAAAATEALVVLLFRIGGDEWDWGYGLGFGFGFEWEEFGGCCGVGVTVDEWGGAGVAFGGDGVGGVVIAFMSIA